MQAAVSLQQQAAPRLRHVSRTTLVRRSAAAAAAPAGGAATTSPTAERFARGEQLVELIVSDVDGTLLTPQQQLAPRTEAALAAAAAAGVPLVLATGKAQGPWRDDVLPRLTTALPQIYLQGLLIVCPQQGVLLRRELETDLVLAAIGFARAAGVTLTAYCGDRIVCERTDEHTDRLLWYKEPPPEGVGPLEAHAGVLPIQKLIFMADDARIKELRPQVEEMFAGRASLTTAISGMLEVLPLGASKGVGVSWLLDHLGVAPSGVMALGDAENDLEMLQLCGLGVAMGNAGERVRAAADAITASNAEDGVAAAIERFVLRPRGLALEA